MSFKLTKESGVQISISAVAAMVPILAAIWLILKPTISDAVAEELTDTIREVVKEEVKPLGDGFRVILLRDIASLRREIARAEARRDAQPSLWTADDATQLVNMRLELESFQSALAAMTPEDPSARSREGQ